MSFPRYPKYRDSGVEWLGDIPGHWEVWKLAHAFKDIGSGTTPKSDNPAYYDDGTTPWLNTGDLNDGELYGCDKNVTVLAFEEHSSLKLYPKNSVAIAMYGATIGKLAILRFATTVNQACCVFGESQRVSTKFLFYWLFGLRQQIISLATGGGQPNISQDILRSLRLACPNLDEQHQIITLLDRETAKIDVLISKQEELISLLAKKRQATISHAATKGLNPTAAMKDSGVEWLGEVPAHWEVGALKRFWTVTDCKHITADFFDEGIPLASIREVQAHYVDLAGAKMTTVEMYEQMIEGGRKPIAGDLIFSRNATVGEVAQVSEDHPIFAMGQDVCLLRKRKYSYSSDYLQYIIRSPIVIEQLKNLMVGSTFKRVNVEEIRGLTVPMPSTLEQGHVVQFLNVECGRLDALSLDVERGMALLRERRSALISAAVTGKVDVRQAVHQEQVSIQEAA